VKPRRSLPLFLLAALILAPVRLSGASRFDVGIVEPLAGAPVFGHVTIVADVRGGTASRVEFWIDDAKAGVVSRPPWRLEVDLGEENVRHRFRVVAFAADGGRAEAELVSEPIQINEVVELPLEQLYVTATRSGNPVLDLQRGDFRVVDGGTTQTLVTFERGDIPLTAVLLVDSSDSMRGAPLAAALAGARAFAAHMAPLDEAQLLLFSDQVVHRTPFTHDPDQLVGGLTGAEAHGGTAINDHLLLALLELERRQGRRVVILLSDGVDVESVLRSADLEAVAGRSPALIYWIRLGGDQKLEDKHNRSVWRNFDQHDAELAGLAKLVSTSGGRILDIAKPDQAADAFGEILAELRNQYVLSWYPAGLRHDGSWRRIRVEVTSGGVDLRARDGYFDD
jgi:Ca-activated chloride channel family protein